ncbi:hypothetical protein SUGI_1164040 [Cryptomeria japonica]|nr:hypothetical protein SUGI_1164040 [Cryptomeria japonica]
MPTFCVPASLDIQSNYGYFSFSSFVATCTGFAAFERNWVIGRMGSNGSGSGRGNGKMKQWMQNCLILALSSYVVLDLFIHSATPQHCECPREVPLGPENGVCASREGYVEAEEGKAWRQMKWVGEAASCRVKGHLIEKLDDLNDFRRGYALKFSPDVEDRTHLLPWLLASRAAELGLRRRRVYLDLGANRFASSVKWFLRMYPCDFTEVHAFELNPRSWRAPRKIFNEDSNLLPAHVPSSNPIRVNSTPGIPAWMMERVKVHYRRVSHRDDESTNSTDITRFIKEELRLTPADTVVVKMDIEGAEWPILRDWINDPQMPQIVDELFVEVHYANPTMSIFGWDSFAPITRDHALNLLADLRWHGFYAHFWP